MSDPHPDLLISRLLAEGDSQGAAIMLTLVDLLARADALGWDQPPALFTLRRNLPPSQLADTLAARGQQVQIMATTGLDIPHGWLVSSDTIEAFLHKLAEILPTVATGVDAGTGGELVGWAMLNEGYMKIEAPEQTTARLAAGRRLIDDPAGQEIRVVIAVDRALTRYEIIRPRHAPPFAAVDPDRESEAERAIQGRFAEALTAVMAATPSAQEG